jgi:FkbM family methyltransferase
MNNRRALDDLPDNHDISHLKAALRYFDGRRAAIDAGAHRGIWTRYLEKQFDVVYAFEPVASLFEQLPEPRFNVAVGDYNGRCGIAPGPDNTGQGHVTNGDDYKMVTIDSLRLQHIDLIKLDIEGYEIFALMGAVKTIQRCRPAIILEKNGLSARYGIADNEVDVWLAERDYRWETRWNKDHLYLPL